MSRTYHSLINPSYCRADGKRKMKRSELDDGPLETANKRSRNSRADSPDEWVPATQEANNSSSDKDEEPKNNRRKAKGKTKKEQTSGKSAQRKFDNSSNAELADVEASASVEHVEDDEDSENYDDIPLNLSHASESPQF